MSRNKERHVVFGPPGTGKTTFLLERVVEALKGGTPAGRIGFLSFTKRAIREAKERAAEVTRETLPYFRTIHSLAYHHLGLQHSDVLTRAQLKDFGDRVGMPFQGLHHDTVLWEGALGDRCLAVHALARARRTSLEHEWRAAPELNLPWKLVKDTVALYERYKFQNALWDFDDMIARAEGTLDVDVLVVDEAQDTSAAQWAFLRRVGSGVPVVYFAGDDDQAVYHWSGADPMQLLRFKGERAVLPVSYRLPRRIKALADKLAGRIAHRVPKAFAPRDEDGAIQWINEVDRLDLHQKGSWLLLARSNYQLAQLRQLARRQGVVYSLADGSWSHGLPAVRAAVSWERLRSGKAVAASDVRALGAFLPGRFALPRGRAEVSWDVVGLPADLRGKNWMAALTGMSDKDREYVRALRRSGESLTHPGRVRIGTVHSVKGAQADHVVLMTDVSERVARGARSDPDAEARVQYVGVTRAKHDLTLVFPQTSTFWSF